MTFVKGKSGNPSGRAKEDPKIKAMWAKHLPSAFQAVQDCLHAEELEIRLKAAQVVFDRNFGRPAQAVDVQGDISLIGINLKK